MKAVACILIVSLCGVLAAKPKDEPKRDKRGYLTGGVLNSAYDYGYGDVNGYSGYSGYPGHSGYSGYGYTGYPSLGYNEYPSLGYNGHYDFSGYPTVVNHAPLVSKVASAPVVNYAGSYAANGGWW